MIKRTQEKILTAILDDSKHRYFVLGIGVTTFILGFAAGAIINFYLLLIHDPLVANFRASLSYKSSIFGDGVILPIINMFALLFLLENSRIIKEKTIKTAVSLGVLITLYFYINQAARGLVNWSMPTPWHWNLLGGFHAVYMFLAASFISLFYLTLIKYMRKSKVLPKEAVIVTGGIILFLILLRLDYMSIVFSLPKF